LSYKVLTSGEIQKLEPDFLFSENIEILGLGEEGTYNFRGWEKIIKKSEVIRNFIQNNNCTFSKDIIEKLNEKSAKNISIDCMNNNNAATWYDKKEKKMKIIVNIINE